MKKHFLLWLMVAALVASACGPAATPTAAPATSAPVQPTVAPTEVPQPTATAEPQPVTITYFTFSAAPDHLKDLDGMIAAFNKVHPEITVKVETAPWDDYFTKLQTLVAGGTAPDVFELNYENFVSYASKGVLLDLTPVIKADSSFDSAVYYPRAYEAFQYKGAQYGLSETFSNVVLFYNEDMFDAAGLAYPDEKWTWNDAIAAAEKLTDPAKDQWGLFKPIQFWEFYKTIQQNGCSFFNEDQTQVTVNDPKCVEALQMMVDLQKKYHVMPTDAEMGGVSDGDLFKSGKLGMLVSGIWMFTAFKDAPFNWDIAVEPGIAQKATHFFSNAVVISKDTPNAQAAYEWAKFFTTSSEAATIRVKSGWELPALNNPDLFKSYLEQTPPANRKAVFDSLNYLVVPPVIERQNEMQDKVNQLLDKVKLGELTAQEALDQAKTEIEALLK